MTKPLTFTIAQINPIVGDFPHNLSLIRQAWDHAPATADIVIFSELCLTGYSPEDLLNKDSFIAAVEHAIETLRAESQGRPTALLIGAPHKNPSGLYNAAYLISNGKILDIRYKHDLPNYGVFDEKRYFTAGPLPEPIEFKGHKLGVMICEDMWYPNVSDYLKARGADILVVLNGSPYEPHKQSVRLQHANLRVEKTGLPLIYVNQVGGQDDLVFDGASFMLTQDGRFVFQSEEFIEDLQTVSIDLPGHFAPIHQETEGLYQAAMTGLRDYVTKNKIGGILLGMSGGIDSALSATIAVDALGADRVRCIMMPSEFTSNDSLEDAADCAQKLGIAHDVIPIISLVNSFTALRPDTSGLAHENLQSRLRGLILMSLSNQSGWMVLSTGNKSEIAMGYATLYGDMCGGYNAIKDLYKTQVYNLAHWRNGSKPSNGLGPTGSLINDRILTKAPTAELKPNQTDQDTLPPYDVLDQLLIGLIEEDVSPQDLIDEGQDATIVHKVAKLLDIAEYKRRQSVPGPKLSSRAFARERRYPITNGFKG